MTDESDYPADPGTAQAPIARGRTQQGRLFAGASLRRARRRAGLTQVAMADQLGISVSYLNLMERNQRAINAAVIVRLAERFGIDVGQLTADQGDDRGAALRRRLNDPRFADLDIDRADIDEWMQASPNTAAAFLRLFDAVGGGTGAPDAEGTVVRAVRTEIERWRNHFADLDAMAETLADSLFAKGNDLYAALVERLRMDHRMAVRIMPHSVLPDHLRRIDLHGRQVLISEMMPQQSRLFQLASVLGQIEAAPIIDGIVAGAGFSDEGASRLMRRHLAGYYAAALMMPYGRFLRACEGSHWDLTVLQRRFFASFEQVAHRLTTMQRVGARGLPFFMLRFDRAGQASKRYAGASNAPLVESVQRCPLWGVHTAFDQSAAMVTDLVELDDGSRWFTMAQRVDGPAHGLGGRVAQFVVVLGVAEHMAQQIGAYIQRHNPTPTLIGLGCSQCARPHCPQRASPSLSRPILLNDHERELSPFPFRGE